MCHHDDAPGVITATGGRAEGAYGPGMRRPSRQSSVTIAALAVACTVPLLALGADGTITTFAGSVPGFAGDGDQANRALLNAPQGIGLTPDGVVLIADTANNRVRRVGTDGIITTVVAQDGDAGFGGDGGPALDATLNKPTDVLVGDGGYWIADAGNHSIRRVGADNTIVTVAGDGTPGLSGDGGPAAAARLNNPRELNLMADGSLLIADTGNHRIRRVAPDGTISTFAGTGPGLSGDGGPATNAALNAPTGTTTLPDGSVLIADTGNDRVRRVAPNGVITTAAGSVRGFAGEGDPARVARLAAPADVQAIGRNGGYLIVDADNNRVRRVTPLGAILTVSGGAPGLHGDNGPASAGLLTTPRAIQSAPGGGVLVADTGNSRIRKLSDVGALPAPRRGRWLSVRPTTGRVNVRPLGAPTTIALREADIAPHRSQVDARTGALTVGVLGPARRPVNAWVAGTQFRMDSPPKGSVIADLRLNEPIACGTASVKKAKATKAVRRKKTRRLRIRVKGRYRTIGSFASAVASGTAWNITDACDRTVIRVTEGRVVVRNRRTGKILTVRAGQRVTILKSGRVVRG